MKRIYIKLFFFVILAFSFGSSIQVAYSENENTSCFSQETLEWLEWFDSLSFNERLSVNYVPHEICVYLTEDNDDYPSEIENVIRLNNYLISGFSLNISLPDISNNRAIIDNPPAGGLWLPVDMNITMILHTGITVQI